MKRRGLKLILALLLGWYVVGPLVETVDFWDDLRAEMYDIACSVGGRVTLLVAGAAFTVVLRRKLKECCSSLARAVRGQVEALPYVAPYPLTITVELPSHSPPSPLRI